MTAMEELDQLIYESGLGPGVKQRSTINNSRAPRRFVGMEISAGCSGQDAPPTSPAEHTRLWTDVNTMIQGLPHAATTRTA